MKWLTNLTNKWKNRDDGQFTEAAGTTVTADEDEGWRRLSGDAQRDLAPLTQTRMQKLAVYAWESNLLARSLIEVPLAYLLAEGVSLVCDDEEAQALLERHWSDPINCWDIKLPKRVRELALFGEQCYPTFVDETTGFVRLGYLDPSLIATVVNDPDNREQPIGIVTTKDSKGRARRYRIIVNGPETVFSERTREIREGFVDGDCFFFRINELSAASRGRSDLLAQIDWLDGYDQFLFSQLDRYEHLSAFIWDITLKGADKLEVEERAKEITAPSPGSARVHNENEVWKAESPSLGAYEASNAARLFRNHILGGATIPEHWFGGAEDVNRATGESMSEPTLKTLTMRQRYLGHMLTEVGVYVLRQAWRAKDDVDSEDEHEILNSVRVDWPEMTAKDTSRFAAALQQVTAAVIQLINEKLLSRETGLGIVTAIAAQLGVSFDARAELDAAAQDGVDALDADRFRDEPLT